MHMSYTNHNYPVRRYAAANRRSLFWNKVADFLLCAVSTMGVIVALFFLLTM